MKKGSVSSVRGLRKGSASFKKLIKYQELLILVKSSWDYSLKSFEKINFKQGCCVFLSETSYRSYKQAYSSLFPCRWNMSLVIKTYVVNFISICCWKKRIILNSNPFNPNNFQRISTSILCLCHFIVYRIYDSFRHRTVKNSWCQLKKPFFNKNSINLAHPPYYKALLSLTFNH